MKAASYLAALLAAACGGGDGGYDAPTPTPTPTTEVSLGVERVFPALTFTLPVALLQAPGDGTRWFVVEQGGRVRVFPNNPQAAEFTPFVDITDRVTAGGEMGLLGMAFHPGFPGNPRVYLSYSHDSETRVNRVSEFRLLPSGNLDPASERILLSVGQPEANHNGGNIAFGPDGYLYIGRGDGGGGNDQHGTIGNGQRMTTLLGKLLRIDVDRGSPYAVPADNPFVGRAGARPEIWAYGLRNPWKFGIDPQSGEVFVADNGWESWEMIHRIVRGGNCGWPVMEGRAALRSEVAVGPTPIIPPIKDHPHSEANSVIGGPVYRGQKLPDLAGAFIYGDYITGTIWAVRLEPDGTYSHKTLVDTDLRIVAFDRLTKVLLVNVGGVFHAYEDRCAHQQVDLSDGQLEANILTCWAHQWQYDVARGVCVNPVAVAMRRFPVKVEDGQVLVDVDAAAARPA
jgi:glucose/arabinose dehydrogenase